MLKKWLRVLVVLKDGEVDLTADQGVQVVFLDLDKFPNTKIPFDYVDLFDKLNTEKLN